MSRIQHFAHSLGFVHQCELDKAVRRAEQAEEVARRWKAQADEDRIHLAAIKVNKKPVWHQGMLLFWVLVIGVLIGGTVVPHANDAPTLAETMENSVSVLPEQPIGGNFPQTFSWARVRGAEGYVIQIWQDGQLVDDDVSRLPTATISLAPGEYQWVVWPVIDGLRQSEAIVNSTLTVT